MVELLLDKGARVNGVTAARVTPAHVAAAAGHISVVARLIKAGCSPKIQDANKQGLLHHAARTGQVEMCKYLLLRPPLPPEPYDERDGLMISTKPIAGTCANAGAVGGTRSVGGTTARMSGAKLLDPNGGDRWHRSPLNWAVVNSHAGVVEVLLSGGANPNRSVSAYAHKRTTTLLQESILHIAVRRVVSALSGDNIEGRMRIVKMLIEAGADRTSTDETGTTLLQMINLGSSKAESAETKRGDFAKIVAVLTEMVGAVDY
jgi:ankyrin repeat protein